MGVPDELKGTEVVCFVVLHPGHAADQDLRAALVQTVVAALGRVDRPRQCSLWTTCPRLEVPRFCVG